MGRWVYFVGALVLLPYLWQYVIQTFDGFNPETMVKGQHVLVCGASKGIGEHIAYQYVTLLLPAVYHIVDITYLLLCVNSF